MVDAATHLSVPRVRIRSPPRRRGLLQHPHHQHRGRHATGLLRTERNPIRASFQVSWPFARQPHGHWASGSGAIPRSHRALARVECHCFSMKELLREFLADLMPCPIDPTPLPRGCDGFRLTRGPRGRFSCSPTAIIREESSVHPTWELMREPNESSGQAVSHDRKTANQDHKANRGQ